MKKLKNMKPALGVLALSLLATTAFTTPVEARGFGGGFGGGCCRLAPSQARRYFNEEGIEVTFQPRHLWQDSQGNMMFGRGCWFLDENGNVVSAWNSQVFDADGNAVMYQ